MVRFLGARYGYGGGYGGAGGVLARGEGAGEDFVYRLADGAGIGDGQACFADTDPAGCPGPAGRGNGELAYRHHIEDGGAFDFADGVG